MYHTFGKKKRPMNFFSQKICTDCEINFLILKFISCIIKMVFGICQTIILERLNNMDINTFSSTYYMETRSVAYARTLLDCKRVAASNANVLLIGESGTGKDVAAQYIHAMSRRADKSFVAVNCNAYTESLLEPELFGVEPGIYSDTIRRRIGKFELADHGTLFLDAIGDVSLTTQVKLLRAIETKEIERLGGNNKKVLDFRLITATSRDLPPEVINGRFREDFFYRISTIVIRIPPLRDRKEDLEGMIHFFLNKSQEENNVRIDRIEDKVWEFLMNYDYPGNIRELKNTIDRMVVLSQNHVITTEGIPILYNLKRVNPVTSLSTHELISWKEFKRRSEREYLEWVLRQTDWNISAASKVLMISTRQIFNKINEYNIEKPL